MCKVNMIIKVGGIITDNFTPQFSQSVEHRQTEKECSIIPNNEISRSSSYRCSLQCALHTLSPVAHPGILFGGGGQFNKFS